MLKTVMADHDLLGWSSKQAPWVSDALRRIATASGLAISEADRQDIELRVRHAAGISTGVEPACEPLTGDHLAPLETDRPRTALLSIGPIQNIDRLAEEQKLRFAASGITLIYGDNGSGKSGYARITKNLCRSLSAQPLKSDVFKPPPLSPQTVVIRFQEGDASVEEMLWTPSDRPPAGLRQISVFDHVNARLYVDKQNRIAYLPTQLAILEHHGALCAALGTKFSAEEKAIEKRLTPTPAGYTAGTAVSDLLAKLASKVPSLPSVPEVRALAGLDQELAQELAALERRLAMDPVAQAAARRRAKQLVDRLVEIFASLEVRLSTEAEQELLEAVAREQVASVAAATAAGLEFADEPLIGVGQESWRILYEAAKAFAASAGLSDGGLPEEPGELCPLCQDPLSSVAAARLARFNAFVSSEAARQADAARDAVRKLKERIEETVVPEVPAVAGALTAFAAMSPERDALVRRVEELLSLYAMRKAALLAEQPDGSGPAIPPVPARIAGELRTGARQLEAQATQLESTAAHSPHVDADRRRMAELKDRLKLGDDLAVVLQRREELQALLALRACQAQVQTRTISTQIGAMRRVLVTDGLQARIQREIDRFGLAHIPFVVKDSSEGGQSLFAVGLHGVGRVATSDVLSEGEQRALALACFLAELAEDGPNYGIIVDDPVSSLDHLRVRRVAERLVEEAAKGRQVIVFTHNLVFFNEMISEAARAGSIPLAKVVVRKTELEGHGVVAEDSDPWIARPLTSRIEVLRATAKALGSSVSDFEGDEYRRLAKDFYSDLRESWERAVEEIVLYKTVERFVPDVMTKRLVRVVVEDDDYKTIFFAMKRASERSGHDMPAARALPVPKPDEMLADVEALDQFRQAYNQRAKDAEKRRTALEQPPKAELV